MAIQGMTAIPLGRRPICLDPERREHPVERLRNEESNEDDVPESGPFRGEPGERTEVDGPWSENLCRGSHVARISTAVPVGTNRKIQ
jgi:hypothetical protein